MLKRSILILAIGLFVVVSSAPVDAGCLGRGRLLRRTARAVAVTAAFPFRARNRVVTRSRSVERIEVTPAAACPSSPVDLREAGTLPSGVCPSGACPDQARSTTTFQSSVDYQVRVLSLVNRYRIGAGLRALALDAALQRQCDAHSRLQAARRSMFHGRYMVRENVAMGQSSPEAVVRDWMNSSGHRANIMSRSVTRMGIGWSGMFWTQQFR